jgi:hypothetical protein
MLYRLLDNFYQLRDNLGNSLVCFLIKHIHCYANTFYTCCERYYPNDVKVMTNSFLKMKNYT